MKQPSATSRSADRLLAVIALSLALCGFAVPPAGASSSFDAWLVGFRSEALEAGVSQSTLDTALSGVTPDEEVLRLDRSQPKRASDFCNYLDRRVTSTRIERAKRLLAEHEQLLSELELEYGVPPRFLVSLWGLESNFGSIQGGHQVIRALATLAHDPRRGSSFRKQLLDALKILDEGHLPPDRMQGSWAGAMGQVQFMPSTFRSYAIDRDGDGRKDIWGSVPDALASAANYLEQAGWRSGQNWGRHVKIPSELEVEGRVSGKASVDEWSRRGVILRNGAALPRAQLEGQVVLPAAKPDPAFLVYSNYHTILNWNRSTFFGISVGTLADRIVGRGSERICSI